MYHEMRSSSWRENVGPSYSQSVHSREQVVFIGGILAQSLVPTATLLAVVLTRRPENSEATNR